MCQLCLISLAKKELMEKNFPFMAIAMENALRINSRLQHKDGHGIFSRKGIHKNTIAASQFTALGFFSLSCMDSTMIGHVRQGSAFAGVKTISEGNTHPFDKKDFVLMHNGFLKHKKEENPKDIIDSEFFANKLQEYITKENVSIEIALPKVMEDFTGKFAFLIFDKIKDRYLVARGSSAELHYAKLISYNDEVLGIIINTTRDSLLDILISVSNLMEYFCFYGEDISVSPSKTKIEEVAKNSLFYLDEEKGELVNICPLVENFEAKTTSFFQGQQTTQTQSGKSFTSGESIIISEQEKMATRLIEVVKFFNADVEWVNNTLFPFLVQKFGIDCGYKDFDEFFVRLNTLKVFIQKRKINIRKKAHKIKSKHPKLSFTDALYQEKHIPEFFMED